MARNNIGTERVEALTENIIIIDQYDQMIGTMEKLAAHRVGALHRAFSIFIFNTKGELLLQQRALQKYHSGGLWTNTCCGHPRPGENTLDAAKRRLMEELGMLCELEKVFHFMYRHEFDSGLVENEYDHVLFGVSDNLPAPNPQEVDAFRYIQPDELKQDLLIRPEVYTAWLNICFEQVVLHLNQN